MSTILLGLGGGLGLLIFFVVLARAATRSLYDDLDRDRLDQEV